MGKKLGAFLREQRINKGLSVRELSEITGISKSYIDYIETGARKPTSQKIMKLANALECSLEELITIQSEEIKENSCVDTDHIKVLKDSVVAKLINHFNTMNLKAEIPKDNNIWGDLIIENGDFKYLIEVKEGITLTNNIATNKKKAYELFGKLLCNSTQASKYAVATTNKTFFEALIELTPKILTNIISLSYIFIDESGAISFLDAENISK